MRNVVSIIILVIICISLASLFLFRSSSPAKTETSSAVVAKESQNLKIKLSDKVPTTTTATTSTFVETTPTSTTTKSVATTTTNTPPVFFVPQTTTTTTTQQIPVEKKKKRQKALLFYQQDLAWERDYIIDEILSPLFQIERVFNFSFKEENSQEELEYIKKAISFSRNRNKNKNDNESKQKDDSSSSFPFIRILAIQTSSCQGSSCAIPSQIHSILDEFLPHICFALSDEVGTTTSRNNLKALINFQHEQQQEEETNNNKVCGVIFKQYHQFINNNKNRRRRRKRIVQLPLGWNVGAFPQQKDKKLLLLKNSSSRKFIYSFIGSIHQNVDFSRKEDDRSEMLKVFQQQQHQDILSPYFVFETTTTTTTMSPFEMIQKYYKNSAFVLCPRGRVSMDTFRIYEALKSGAIPVIVAKNKFQIEETFSKLFSNSSYLFQQSGWLFATSWEEAVEKMKNIILLERNENNKSFSLLNEIQNKCLKSWELMISNIHDRILEEVDFLM